MYSLVSVPYYDHHTQCYKKVIKTESDFRRIVVAPLQEITAKMISEVVPFLVEIKISPLINI